MEFKTNKLSGFDEGMFFKEEKQLLSLNSYISIINFIILERGKKYAKSVNTAGVC